MHPQPTRTDRHADAGRALLAEAAGTPNLDWLPDTTAWGVFGTRAGLDDYAGPAPQSGRIRLGVHTPAGGRALEPAALVLTAGAFTAQPPVKPVPLAALAAAAQRPDDRC